MPVLAEPQSFLQPMLLEKWRETRADLFQTVRLFGLEVQELKDKTTQLFPLFALMRKSLLPLQADVPEALKTVNEHLENLKDNVDSLTTEEHGVYEAATQSVLAAFKSLEDRLWRAQRDFKSPLAGAQAAMTQACQEAKALQAELKRFHPQEASESATAQASTGEKPPWQ